MPYSNNNDVRTWSQITTEDIGSVGYDFTNSVQYTINVADNMIDNHCNVPSSFFEGGGIQIDDEYHDGVEEFFKN